MQKFERLFLHSTHILQYNILIEKLAQTDCFAVNQF